MYLSKLELDIANPSARQAIINCNDMHRNLMRAFLLEDGNPLARAEVKLLYRVDEARAKYTLLVMSGAKPEWRRIAKNGYALVGEKDISALRGALVKGKALGFSLRASPTKKVSSEAKNSRRVFLRTERERAEWLERQGEKYGFALVSLREDSVPRSIYGKKGSMEIRYNAADYTGILSITDADAFYQAYTGGIGAGKAYGLGLLALSKA